MRAIKQLAIPQNTDLVKFPNGTILNETDTEQGTPVIEEIYGDVLTNIYKENLCGVYGINFLEEKDYIKYNYQYFPILINKDQFGISRDQVYKKMREYNVFPRKYFYPLCVDYKYYKKKIIIPSARRIVNEVLCLPLYGELTENDIEKICDILLNLNEV